MVPGPTKPVDAYDILHLVSDVGAVLADAGVPRAHVVGHDWGAAAAWALASMAPDTVDRYFRQQYRWAKGAVQTGRWGVQTQRADAVDVDSVTRHSMSLSIPTVR